MSKITLGRWEKVAGKCGARAGLLICLEVISPVCLKDLTLGSTGGTD